MGKVVCLLMLASGLLAQYSPPAGGGSGAVPGGANTQVQFNNSGAFGGSPDLTWTTNGMLNLRTGGIGNASWVDPNGNPNDPGVPYISAINAYNTLSTPGLSVPRYWEGHAINAYLKLSGLTGNLTKGIPSGAAINLEIAPDSSATYGPVYGINGSTVNNGTGNITALNGLLYGALNFSPITLTSVIGGTLSAQNLDGTVTNIYGAAAQAISGGTSNATNAVGFLALSNTKGASATLTNSYGILVNNQAAGTNNWAIKTGTGVVEFGGITKAPGFLAKGVTFSPSGCSVSDPVGGATAGTITSGTTGSCAITITMGSSMTATNGWACGVSNQTTANLIRQTGGSTTTATFDGVTITGDIISFNCMGY